MIWLLALLACSGGDTYIVEGTVVKVNSPTEVVIQHEQIDGYMDAMTMPFTLGPKVGELQQGDQVIGRLLVEPDRSTLVKVRVTGTGAVPALPAPDVLPIQLGAVLPRTAIGLSDGSTMIIGAGQGKPTVITFLYTTCPLPEFCPLATARLQALQDAVGTDASLLAVTLDPEGDTLQVLSEYAAAVGARSDVWRFGRVEGKALDDLAMRAALTILPADGEIAHATRWLVLDADGVLIERYDDNRWPLERVVSQVRTGQPLPPSTLLGTVSPRD
jgi:protein SCO1/2